MAPHLIRRRAAPGAVLLALLGLAACGRADAPEATAAPPPTATPTATPAAPPPASKDIGVPKDYDCAGTAVEAIYFEHTAMLRLDGETVRLDPVAVASGSRYQGWRADGVLIDFWEKGGTAILSVAGNDYPECSLIDTPVEAEAGITNPSPRPDVENASPESQAIRTYTARGNEPFWLVQIDATEARWNTPDHVASDVFTGLARTTRADGFDVSATREGSALALSAKAALCRDSMSGLPYPDTVTVRLDGADYRGCGGDPRALLAGEWTVASLNGTSTGESPPTLQFTADGGAGGFAGCNRWTAGAMLTGEGLAFERPASTMMACPEAAMATEKAFLAALSTVTRHDIDDAGQLVLFAGDTAVITATPAPADAGAPEG